MTVRRFGVLVALVGLVLPACSGDDRPDPAGAPSGSASASPTAEVTPTPPPRAQPVRVPADDACYVLSYRDALAPTTDARPVPCARPHTVETFAVGTVDNVVDGHLLAIDSDRVQQQVATTCPEQLGDAVGGTLADRRLSMLRAVWFTPSLERAAAGAEWYRCDVVALAGAQDLVRVQGSLRGVLDTPEGRDAYGMCGTTSPDARGFERVACSTEHTWRAFSVLPLDGDRYPGARAVAEAGAACEDAAAEVADDPLDYEWAYEGPDAAEWATGQTFVRCWAPD